MSESVTGLSINQEAEHEKPVDWDAVFEAVGEVGLPLDPVERAKDVSNMTAEDLAMMTAYLHSVLAPNADISPSDKTRYSVDPNTQEVTATFLDPDKRLPLYKYASSLIYELSQDMDGNEEMFLRRAGNILALATLQAHPFKDGNGRTARFVSHLIRHAESRSPEDTEELKMLGSSRPDSGYRVISYVPKDNDMRPEALLDSAASLEIPLNEPEAYRAATQQVFTTPYPTQ